MIKHIWSVLCSRAVIDKDSNNVSIQNVIEQIKVSAEPKPDSAIPVPFVIVTLWMKTDENLSVIGHERIMLVYPSQISQVVSEELKIDLSSSERSRNMVRFPGLLTSESGRHIFRIEYRLDDESDWRVAASIPLRVTFTPPESESV